jgi:hypothetical protein
MKTFKKQKLNSTGFSHVELLLVIVVVVAIAGAGVLVYKHDHKSTKSSVASLTNNPLASSTPVKGSSVKGILPEASAYNLSHITSNQKGWDIYACKQYVASSYYGPYYHIIDYSYKPATGNSGAAAEIEDYGTNGVVRSYQVSGNYLYGTVTGLTLNVSVFNNQDWIYFNEHNGNGGYAIQNSFQYPQMVADIVSC